MANESNSTLDSALEAVLLAARNHLEAVKAANGHPDDDAVWSAYVELNNAVVAYDDAMLDRYNEVTPWDVSIIDPEVAAARLTAAAAQPDAEPIVIAVRQRRDFLVPNAAVLMDIAQRSRVSAEDSSTVASVGEAILELMHAGDGSMSALDIPELEPLEGVVTVSEVADSLNLDAVAEDDVDGLFAAAEGEKLVGRFDEQPFDEDDDE